MRTIFIIVFTLMCSVVNSGLIKSDLKQQSQGEKKSSLSTAKSDNTPSEQASKESKQNVNEGTAAKNVQTVQTKSKLVIKGNTRNSKTGSRKNSETVKARGNRINTSGKFAKMGKAGRPAGVGRPSHARSRPKG